MIAQYYDAEKDIWVATGEEAFPNRCMSLQHKPPTALYFVGEYTHVCPDCGNKMVLTQREVRL